MKGSHQFSVVCCVLAVVALGAGCATGPKQLRPVDPPKQADLLKGMEVVQEPSLEPEWADFVKQNYPSWQRHYWVDRGQWGNRGYLVGKPAIAPNAPSETKLTALPPAVPAVEPPTIVNVEPPPAAVTTDKNQDRPTTYVVKKGDSLWKIAGKVYGNPLKWTRLYRANKAKLKSANKIYPGQVLTVPWD